MGSQLYSKLFALNLCSLRHLITSQKECLCDLPVKRLMRDLSSCQKRRKRHHLPSEFACTIPLQRPTWDVIQNFHHKDNIKHAVPHRNHTCVSLNYANPTIFELKTSKSVTIDADADHSKSSVPCEHRKMSCFSAYVHRGFDAQLQKRLRNELSPSL